MVRLKIASLHLAIVSGQMSVTIEGSEAVSIVMTVQLSHGLSFA